MTSHPNALHEITLVAGDGARSLTFYRDLLGFPLVAQPGATTWLLDMGNGHRLHLQSAAAPTQPSPWLPDDLQPGYRHLGFQVQSTDATSARLKAAQVLFTLDPLDATGGVRIAFFKDPDGILLEVVEGSLTYHRTGSAVTPVRPDRPQPHGQGELVFDHIAITVADLERALRFYQDNLGFPLLGQLLFHDARGFMITYLQAGLGVLELFSFSRPTLPRPVPAEQPTLGVERIGFVVDNLAALEARLTAAGLPTSTEREDGRLLVTDVEGNPLAFTQREAA
jgi:catechol 2,3-dioxygenase-like lactoylglutathione lyase family enzyme